MRSVEPIRNVDDIERIKGYLKEKNERDYILFMFGIYSGIRISDFLGLKVKDVKGDRVFVVEKKTKKAKPFAINPKLRKALNQYIENKELKDYDFLFPSRKRDKRNGVQFAPIQRKTAWEIVKKAGQHIGLENLGSHSMRKTFGYHYYIQTHDVVTLQKIFNHSTPTITLIYIGYQQDELDEAILTFDY
ncbi:TPA: site-specific integrase [Streptococcus suis]|nr:site-specific integrase [Streptococcus suis]